MTSATLPAGPPPHTPEAGLERARRAFGDRIPEITDETRQQVDRIIEQARRMTAGGR